MTKDNSEERETICLVSDPAYRGGPSIKWPPGYFTPPSEPANKVATTADLNNALMEATIKELEKLEPQFQRYDDILTALTNARRIVARHLLVNLTDPATTLKSSNKMRGIASLKPRHAIPATTPMGLHRFGWEWNPSYIVRDRDFVYGEFFTRRLRAMGIRDWPTAPQSPWQNGHTERLNKQRRFTDEFKREAVRLIETSERSVQRVAHDLGIAKSTLSQWRSRRCDVARKKYQDDGCRIARHTRQCRGILTYQEARSEPRDLCRG